MNLRFLSTLAAGSLLSTGSFATTWQVRPDGTGDALTIQGGIDLAASGDTVEVACGTYNEHSLQLGSGITLRSETGQPDCVTVDAGQLGGVLYCENVHPASRIEGLTLTGGLKSIGPVLREATGAGAYCENAEVTFADCVLIGNQAGSGGGALHCLLGSSLTLLGCTLTANTTTDGGGGALVAQDPVLAEDCTFSANGKGRSSSPERSTP